MNSLNYNHREGDAPRISSQHLLKQLATQSMKHIAGASNVIDRVFSTKAVPNEIKSEKPINLVLHMGHTH